MKVAKSFADYAQRQENLRESIRQEEIRKLQEETEQLIDVQWKSQEEEICCETLEEIKCQKSHLQPKENEWAKKIKQQKELSQQLEENYKSVRSQESKRLTELQNQLQEKQLETERHWSELTNTWAAKKICRDNKVEELKTALETAKEQQAAKQQAWKAAVEEEKTEKAAQVNQLIEKVKGMELNSQKLDKIWNKNLRVSENKHKKNIREMSN